MYLAEGAITIEGDKTYFLPGVLYQESLGEKTKISFLCDLEKVRPWNDAIVTLGLDKDLNVLFVIGDNPDGTRLIFFEPGEFYFEEIKNEKILGLFTLGPKSRRLCYELSHFLETSYGAGKNTKCISRKAISFYLPSKGGVPSETKKGVCSLRLKENRFLLEAVRKRW